MKALIAASLSLVLVGCQTTAQLTPTTVPIQVAVPIKCQVDKPVRPVMPTETLASTATPFEITRAALAEIDFHNAYEGELEAALESCM